MARVCDVALPTPRSEEKNTKAAFVQLVKAIGSEVRSSQINIVPSCLTMQYYSAQLLISASLKSDVACYITTRFLRRLTVPACLVLDLKGFRLLARPNRGLRLFL